MESDSVFYENLTNLVASRILCGGNSGAQIRTGPQEINDFSVCFWMERGDENGKGGIYVKIPKSDFSRNSSRNVLPITERDKSFARNEYESLLCLAKHWNSGGHNTRFVSPLAFFDDYNAIITKREYLPLAFRFFRRWNYTACIGLCKNEGLMRAALEEIAKGLARFHNIWSRPASLKTTAVVEKIGRYCHELANAGVKKSVLVDMFKRLKFIENINLSTSITMTRTLKGLDVRNIFINKSGRLVMFDPGAMKWDYREADLARFLVTLKILYWGSMPFLLQLVPKRTFFEAFIKAYYGHSSLPESVLTLFVIKELFKHWRMVHVKVLPIKRWPPSIKRMVSLIYVDPFYRKHIKRELAKFERQSGRNGPGYSLKRG